MPNDDAAQTPQQPQPPQLKTLSQFTRSFHFTNDAAANNVAARGAPTINVKVDVKDQPAADNRHVVTLDLEIEANAQDEPIFTVEVEYVGVFEIIGVADAKLQAVLKVECPRLLFPFARRLIADATREGGFPPLLLDPIDFLGLYLKRGAHAEPETPAKPNGQDSE